MKSVSFLTMHRQQQQLTRSRPRKDVRTSVKQSMWHQWILWSYENIVCKENKNNNFIQQFIFFYVHLRHAFMRVPCMWCWWHRSQLSDVEHPSLLVHNLYILVQVSKARQNIASHFCRNLLTCLPRLCHVQHLFCTSFACKQNTVHSVLRQNAGSCVSSTKLLRNVTWTVLTMSSIPFWAIPCFSFIAVYSGSKRYLISSKISYLCSEEGLMGLEWYKNECLLTELSSFEQFFTWYFKKSYIYLYKTRINTVS